MSTSRRLLDVLERRVPAIARAISTPAVRGATSSEEDAGTVWRAGTDHRALVVYLTDAPALSRWLAGSIALRLQALVLVPPVSAEGTDAAAIATAIGTALARAAASDELPTDAPVAIVAEGATASLGISSSRGTASRLALLYPNGVTSDRASATALDRRADAASRIPTTLIQAPASGPSRPEVTALDHALRAAGTAVRETEYAAVAEGWARHPRASKGSGRALDDLVAFLDRGIGEASTFDVIPGWDLH